jgi:glycogen debranching enzyme
MIVFRQSTGDRLRSSALWVFAIPILIQLCSPVPVCAQAPYIANPTSSLRFAAAHGERALVGGNAAAGLEAWVYPLQILRGLKPSFVEAGRVDAVPGDRILRSIEYTPTAIVRTFASSDFTVNETLFVPRALGGVVISYEIDSAHPVAVQLSFVPVLDLMWPVGIGGQEINWKTDENTYEMQEPSGRFHAVFGGPDLVAHDDPVNTNAPLDSEHHLKVMLRPGRVVRFLIAGSTTTIEDARATYTRIRDDSGGLESEATRAQREWASRTLRIDTPDEAVNQALAWSQWALEQAWVCNPALGCELVAGYGPSRGLARRPQYAWFFANDALTDLPALLLSGDFEHGRQALEFMLKYQDSQTGMMWHELSQSAAYVHWTDYPYMFVHVDVTFLFLEKLQTYARMTGDVDFLRTHWDAISKAYQYCQSLIDPGDGLPRVPAGKVGMDEQRHPREELSLAVSWMQASAAFANLARLSGHEQLAPAAEAARTRAAAAIPTHFWNTRTNYFASGILNDGTAEPEMHLPPEGAISLLDAARRAAVLDRIAGPEFQTAWGTRSVGTASPTYDPGSYATGSVWVLTSATAASELWQAARPEAAWAVWRSLLPWFMLDSMGHLHETLSGSEFQPQIESVPEQTWSSAMFVSSFLTGAAGLTLDADAHTATFAPALPSGWDHLGLENVRMGSARISLRLRQARSSEDIELSGQGVGPLTVRYIPQRTGERIAEATVDGRRLTLPRSGEPIALVLKIDGNSHHLVIRYVAPRN